MKKLSAYECWKLKEEKSMSNEEYKQLLKDNGILIPKKCPITGKPFFMEIVDETGDLVPTYGGPFDSYTIPVKDEDGNYTTSRFCHDRGCWVGEETIYQDLGFTDQPRNIGGFA